MINRARGNYDVHRDATIHGGVGRAVSHHFDIIIPTRLEISFEATRDVFDSQISVRPRKQIGYLAAERLGTVNGLTTEGDVSEKILATFVNWYPHINFIALRQKLFSRSIDYGIQKTFSDIKPLHQMRPFFRSEEHTSEL